MIGFITGIFLGGFCGFCGTCFLIHYIAMKKRESNIYFQAASKRVKKIIIQSDPGDEQPGEHTPAEQTFSLGLN